MKNTPFIVRVRDDAISFWLTVKPRSAREHFGVDSSGEFRLQVHAPAVGGAANEACIGYLARLLRISRSSIEIVMGDKSRKKLIRIRGGEEIARKLWSSAGVALNQADD